MVAIFALAAAVLYGTADFLGGAASRRTSALAVLSVTAPAGLVVAIIAALAARDPFRLAGFGWAVAGGAAGGVGFIAFYAGLAAGPIASWHRSRRWSPRSCRWAWRSRRASGPDPRSWSAR